MGITIRRTFFVFLASFALIQGCLSSGREKGHEAPEPLGTDNGSSTPARVVASTTPMPSVTAADLGKSKGSGLGGCASQVMCTMEYMPSTCTFTRKEQSTSATGTNGCQARQNLLAQLCRANVINPMPSEIVCTAGTRE